VRKLMPMRDEGQGSRAHRRHRIFRQGRRHQGQFAFGRREGAAAAGLATFYGPNMIILDEPTNHLDIDSRAALAEAINDFPGAVIMVSHDRYLIEACADQLWVVADRA
jgi:ATPase subunit of ABC transporter with duplicated ATPase domains